MTTESKETALDVAVFAVKRRNLFVSLASICLEKWSILQSSEDPFGLMVSFIVDICSKVKFAKQEQEPRFRDLMVCSICKCIFFDATTVACGHTYCRTCIGDKPSFVCPTCGFCSANGIYHINVIVNKCVDKAHPLEKEKRNIRSNGNAFMSRQEYQKAIAEYSTGLKLGMIEDFSLFS